MLECVEGIDEVENFIAKMIMDAMEEFIGDDTINRQADDNVLERVNLVNDKAAELYENLMRKVSVSEVASELNISEEKVIEAIKLSANRIEYIDYKEDDN
jgi:RNA polymerase primary sigma factor